jgi:hypothetical protein
VSEAISSEPGQEKKQIMQNEDGHGGDVDDDDDDDNEGDEIEFFEIIDDDEVDVYNVNEHLEELQCNFLDSFYFNQFQFWDWHHRPGNERQRRRTKEWTSAHVRNVVDALAISRTIVPLTTGLSLDCTQFYTGDGMRTVHDPDPDLWTELVRRQRNISKIRISVSARTWGHCASGIIIGSCGHELLETLQIECSRPEQGDHFFWSASCWEQDADIVYSGQLEFFCGRGGTVGRWPFPQRPSSESCSQMVQSLIWFHGNNSDLAFDQRNTNRA